MHRSLAALALLTLVGCASSGVSSSTSSSTAAAPASTATSIRPDDVRALMFTLAADSMEGRNTGRPGSMKAARVIADWFRRAGLTPAGDSGFFQRVPMKAREGRNGRSGATGVASFADLDTVPRERRLYGGNVVGVLEGSDPVLRNEVVLVDAHYDHLGIGQPVQGDSIFNGADDDASGTATVMLIARALAAGDASARPKRTIVFAATTGEETGLVGTRWYIAHPARPLARMVANLEIEMIGRPDSLAGGPGRAWLTGYDRSTMGDALKARGIPIVADPRPDQNFFQRSDNIAFAYCGIPAHTLSTFNLHTDYHTVFDSPDRLDYAHMARVIESAVDAVRLLANEPAPTWKPNGRPTAPAGRAPQC